VAVVLADLLLERLGPEVLKRQVLANVRHAEGSPLLAKVTAAEQGLDLVSPPRIKR
jgi:hypothetical protein